MQEKTHNIVIQNSVWEWAFAVFFCLLSFQGTWTYNVALFQGQRYSIITANEALAIAAAFTLTLALAIGPAFRLTGGKSSDIRLRRPLAVSGTLLAIAHIFLTANTERSLMPTAVYHKCVMLGALATFLMILLAATAWPWALRKLGQDGWKKVHKAAVFLPFVIMAHYLVLGKAAQWQEWFSSLGEPGSTLAPSSTFLLTAFCVLVLMLRAVDYIVQNRASK